MHDHWGEEDDYARHRAKQNYKRNKMIQQVTGILAILAGIVGVVYLIAGIPSVTDTKWSATGKSAELTHILEVKDGCSCQSTIELDWENVIIVDGRVERSQIGQRVKFYSKLVSYDNRDPKNSEFICFAGNESCMEVVK